MISKKLNNYRILLSVVALLAIFAVAVGITYSWIEGGTTYSMQTNENGDIIIGSIPEYVEYGGTVKLNPSVTTELVLTDYDNTTGEHQDLYFSPVSSNDGINFFVPDAYGADGNPVSYRAATTNDIGTKYISFDFNVKAESLCYLAFNDTPSITVTKSGTPVSDTSAFRIMISDGTDSHIFSTAEEAQSSTVVTAVDDEGTPTTATLTTKLLKDCVDNSTTTKNRLFKYSSGDTATISVSVWLDSAAASGSKLFGCDVSLNLSLIVAQPKNSTNFDAVSYDNETPANKFDNGFTGGSIKISSTTHTDKFTHYAVEGTSFTATAVPATNYTFEGWYTDADCEGTPVTTPNLSVSSTEANDGKTYYAKFVEKPKHTISVNTITVPSGTGGTVSILVNDEEISGNSYTGYKDSEVEIVATPNTAEGYRFDGWYKDAECSTKIGTGYKTESQTITIGSADQDYYAKFVKQYTVTIKTMTDKDKTNTAGGYVMLNGAASTYKEYSEKADYNGSKSLYATEATGYTFEGFYKEDGTKLAKTTSPASVSGFTADTTYYANFTTNSYTVTYKIYTNGEAGTNGGQIGFDGSTWYSTDKTASVKYNETTNLYAKEADGYKLDSIYLDGDTSATVSSGGSITVTGNVTYIANFVPSSTGYELRYTGNWTDGLDMNYTDSTQKYVSVTAEFVAGVYDFKIYDGSSWYGKDTSATIIYETNSNLSLDSPGNNNIKFYSYGGTYTFIFGTEDSSLQVIAENNNAITVYFTNSKNWSGTMYCHFWGGSYGTSWPGLAMTYVKTNNQSQKIYKMVIPSNTTGIVFNNNSGSQSPDITTNIVDGKGFYIDDSGNVGTYTYS